MMDPESVADAHAQLITITLTRGELMAAATCLNVFLLEHAPVHTDTPEDRVAVAAWATRTKDAMDGMLEMYSPSELLNLAHRILAVGLEGTSPNDEG